MIWLVSLLMMAGYVAVRLCFWDPGMGASKISTESLKTSLAIDIVAESLGEDLDDIKQKISAIVQD
jgi:hypothetical protein